MKKNKLIHILCSMLIGVLLVVFVLAALIFSGVIRIGKIDLVIATSHGEALYDGAPLTNHTWILRKGKLKPGHTMELTFTGTQTAVGESENTVDVKITDELGADVTGDYNISYELGHLKVNPRVITITSADDTKDYDGYALKNHNFEITSEHRGLVHGHSAMVEITGSITDIGETTNTVKSVTIYDEKGADVTRNYQIFIREGLLRVTNPLGVSSTPDFDGNSSLLAGEEYTNTVLYSIYSYNKDTVYLKIRSYGNYTGKGWAEASSYSKLYENKYAASYLTSFALKDAKAQKLTIKIKSNFQPYALPYYVAPEGNLQKSDTLCEGGITDIYTVSYYRYSDNITLSGAKSTAYEKEYRDFVYNQYLTIDDQSLKYMEQIIAAQGFSPKDKDIVAKVAKYIQNAALYNLKYNGELDKESNVAIAFLDKYKEGVCRHYASAATLLYRALGIPARYTVGALAELKPDQWNNVNADQAHAWVEVYLDGIGWINVEVTGSDGVSASSSGSGSASSGGNEDQNDTSKKEVELRPKTVRKKYDGKVLRATNVITGFEAFEKLGYTYKAKVVGERTELGVTQSAIESITLYDETGKDVTSTFNIKLYGGKVHVYSKVIYFKSESYNIIYDGKSLKAGVMTGGDLTDGHRILVTSTASTNAGVQLNTFRVTVLDDSLKDVTDIYYVAKTYGTVNIAPIEITVKADDATKKYDGTPLTCNTLSVIEGALLDGHKIAFYIITGSQTDIGRSENAIEHISIHDAYGNDVTSNYIINLKPGKLKVTGQ